jgi:hypothetical protein
MNLEKENSFVRRQQPGRRPTYRARAGLPDGAEHMSHDIFEEEKAFVETGA